MGTYPAQYPAPAITVAQTIVTTKFFNRLTNEGWNWEAQPYLMSKEELESIRVRFVPGVKDELLLRFIGLVFAKTMPALHLHFVSDGYLLDIQNDLLVIREQPPTFDGFGRRANARSAALTVVRSLIELRLAAFADRVGSRRFPLATDNHDLVLGRDYPWILYVGEFGYARTRSVIDFVHEAAPALRAEWESEGLVLRPVYHDALDYGGKCFIALQLQPVSSA